MGLLWLSYIGLEAIFFIHFILIYLCEISARLTSADFTYWDLEISLFLQQRDARRTTFIIICLCVTLCVVLCGPTRSAQRVDRGWPPRHPTTAAVKTRTRTTPWIRWYLARAARSCITPYRSAWLNTRTGECASARCRLSKTAWWASKTHGRNSWGGSRRTPLSLHRADLWCGVTALNLIIWESAGKNLYKQKLFISSQI